MRKIIILLAAVACIASCNSASTSTEQASLDTSTVNPVNEWKFGVALWTFHNMNFPDALLRIDSAGLQYIEPNTFHAAGPELKDSLIMQLSPAGVEKLKAMITEKGMKAESIYIVGDSTIGSWVKQFEIAKQLGVKFVTTEPPLHLWDELDSLAGMYGMQVAIHEHWRGMSNYWDTDTTLMALKGRPNFKVCADLGHWPKSGINPLDAVKKLEGYIIGVHFKDIAAYNNPALVDVTAGTGVVDFPAILAELKRQDFKGHIYIERDSTEQPNNLQSVKKAVDYYNAQISKLK
jgi:L-ribulose-5-phosphate 3-epimerase